MTNKQIGNLFVKAIQKPTKENFEIVNKTTKEKYTVSFEGINGNWYIKEKIDNDVIPYTERDNWIIV